MSGTCLTAARAIAILASLTAACAPRLHVPFSLEHVGPAWSPDFALSASALNAWMWEDTSLAGLEGEWWRTFKGGIKVDALVGLSYGTDQLGRLLALRGWAIGDALGGWNGDLQLPAREERTKIFVERDDRPAAYVWVTLSDEQEVATLKVDARAWSWPIQRNRTSSCGLGSGNSFKTSASAMLNTTAFAPSPNASDSTAAKVSPLLFPSMRQPNRMSCKTE